MIFHRWVCRDLFRLYSAQISKLTDTYIPALSYRLNDKLVLTTMVKWFPRRLEVSPFKLFENSLVVYWLVSPNRTIGVRQRVWSCCPTPQATPCQVGPHVFKVSLDSIFSACSRDLTRLSRSQEEDPLDLHSRVDFISSSSLSPPSSSTKSEVQDLVALDCELFYTTAGLSLARLTVVSAEGDLLYDTHVLPPLSATIVDLNTRYSGIVEQDLEKAEKDLVGVRKELARWVGENTVIVGHGAENDLRALRLVHKRVIDTAIVSFFVSSSYFWNLYSWALQICSSSSLIRMEVLGDTRWGIWRKNISKKWVFFLFFCRFRLVCARWRSIPLLVHSRFGSYDRSQRERWCRSCSRIGSMESSTKIEGERIVEIFVQSPEL